MFERGRERQRKTKYSIQTLDGMSEHIVTRFIYLLHIPEIDWLQIFDVTKTWSFQPFLSVVPDNHINLWTRITRIGKSSLNNFRNSPIFRAFLNEVTSQTLFIDRVLSRKTKRKEKRKSIWIFWMFSRRRLAIDIQDEKITSIRENSKKFSAADVYVCARVRTRWSV